jgi:hypothetical protein
MCNYKTEAMRTEFALVSKQTKKKTPLIFLLLQFCGIWPHNNNNNNNSTDSPPWEATIRSSSQEITRLLWNRNFHNWLHKSLRNSSSNNNNNNTEWVNSAITLPRSIPFESHQGTNYPDWNLGYLCPSTWKPPLQFRQRFSNFIRRNITLQLISHR